MISNMYAMYICVNNDNHKVALLLHAMAQGFTRSSLYANGRICPIYF